MRLKIYQKGRIVKKTWGFEESLAETSEYTLKILHYDKAGNFSSFHLHPKNKSEHFKCVAGSFVLTSLDEKGYRETYDFNLGDIVSIPRGTPHKLVAKEDNSEILEVSNFDDQSDIIRLEPSQI
jgi:mannose-6-phosphate isomerase-like protein (cupin superfamily)